MGKVVQGSKYQKHKETHLLWRNPEIMDTQVLELGAGHSFAFIFYFDEITFPA